MLEKRPSGMFKSQKFSKKFHESYSSSFFGWAKDFVWIYLSVLFTCQAELQMHEVKNVMVHNLSVSPQMTFL